MLVCRQINIQPLEVCQAFDTTFFYSMQTAASCHANSRPWRCNSYLEYIKIIKQKNKVLLQNTHKKMAQFYKRKNSYIIYIYIFLKLWSSTLAIQYREKNHFIPYACVYLTLKWCSSISGSHFLFYHIIVCNFLISCSSPLFSLYFKTRSGHLLQHRM